LSTFFLHETIMRMVHIAQIINTSTEFKNCFEKKNINTIIQILFIPRSHLHNDFDDYIFMCLVLTRLHRLIISLSVQFPSNPAFKHLKCSFWLIHGNQMPSLIYLSWYHITKSYQCEINKASPQKNTTLKQTLRKERGP